MSTCKFNTVEAENGRIALDEMRKPENDFDLVLLDLMMPEMNGYDVLEAMKNDPKLSEIPVVVMSATDSQESVSHCLCKFWSLLDSKKSKKYEATSAHNVVDPIIL